MPVRLVDVEVRDSGQRGIGVLEITSTIAGERAVFVGAQARYAATDLRLRCDWLNITPESLPTRRSRP